MYTLSDWVKTPENALPWTAVQRVADCVCSRRRKREVNPLFLHGSTGTGKSHLVCGLAAEITQRCPDLIVSIVEAHDYAIPLKKERISAPEPAQTCDVLIVEDLQHLPVQASPLLAQVFDSRLSRHQQMIFTALAGPGQLPQLPARLAARLASGLVVALRPLCRASRLPCFNTRPGNAAWPLRAISWTGLVSTLEAVAGKLWGP
jgi:chromosomal replication initiator protein